MKDREDHFWQELLARVDLDGSDDPAQLRAAEQRLAGAGADPLLVTVARPRRARRWLSAAAALPLGLLLAAGVVIIVLWPARQYSHDTMTYPMAVEILARSDQPEESMSAAMKFTLQRVAWGIDTMHRLAQAGPAGDPLADVARDHLTATLLALDVPEPAPTAVDDSMEASRRTALAPTVDVPLRQAALGHVASLTRSGIAALRTMRPASESLGGQRDATLVTVRQMLRR